MGTFKSYCSYFKPSLENNGIETMRGIITHYVGRQYSSYWKQYKLVLAWNVRREFDL